MLEKILEGPLDCKEIQPVHSEGDRPWDFFGRNDAKAETPVLWPPHVKSWLIGKGSDAGRDWGQEEKGTTEDEMAGWHHQLDGREFEWTPGVGDGQGGLAHCNSWGCKESDRTERLNWIELNVSYLRTVSGLNLLANPVIKLSIMGVGLVRSLQPPDILLIHWRAYNSTANTGKGVLFLPPSDAYVRSFLYLLYTLIKLY